MSSLLTLFLFDSFAPSFGQAEYDCRFVYCAFAISEMLNDWSAIDVDAAVHFLMQSRVSQKTV